MTIDWAKFLPESGVEAASKPRLSGVEAALKRR